LPAKTYCSTAKSDRCLIGLAQRRLEG